MTNANAKRHPCLADGGRRAPRSASAFTLVETLVVIVIIAGMSATLLPAISSARAQMMQVTCSSNLRSIALDFQFFADGTSAEGRGDSDTIDRSRFQINDFQDFQYRVDEFWDHDNLATATLSTRDARMLCPAGPPQLDKHKGFPCGSEAIGPPTDVSLAFNMRLYRAAVEFAGHTVLAPVSATRLRSNVLNHPYVPLLLDANGATAAERGIEPFYTSPPRPNSDDPYADGRYWIPSDRHRGRTNVAFVGGHVLSSNRPAKEAWNWDYQPEIGN